MQASIFAAFVGCAAPQIARVALTPPAAVRSHLKLRPPPSQTLTPTLNHINLSAWEASLAEQTNRAVAAADASDPDELSLSDLAELMGARFEEEEDDFLHDIGRMKSPPLDGGDLFSNPAHLQPAQPPPQLLPSMMMLTPEAYAIAYNAVNLAIAAPPSVSVDSHLSGDGLASKLRSIKKAIDDRFPGVESIYREAAKMSVPGVTVRYSVRNSGAKDWKFGHTDPAVNMCIKPYKSMRARLNGKQMPRGGDYADSVSEIAGGLVYYARNCLEGPVVDFPPHL